MSLLGWVTSHTGLPALYAVGNGVLTAEHYVFGATRSRFITSVSGSALVADPGAAVGYETTYKFGADSVVLMRAAAPSEVDATHQWVTDFDGDLFADVQLTGDDERHYDTGGEVFTSALGRQVPRYSLGVTPPTGTLEFLTTGAGTETLRSFVAERRPLWVVHNHYACKIPGCDIEGSRLIVPSSMREVRSARTDVAQRAWTVEYSRVPDSLADQYSGVREGVPVVTWGQWEKWGTRQPAASRGWRDWSALQVAQRVAGMPSI